MNDIGDSEYVKNMDLFNCFAWAFLPNQVGNKAHMGVLFP